jgi:hypothetical protein
MTQNRPKPLPIVHANIKVVEELSSTAKSNFKCGSVEKLSTIVKSL